MQYQEDLSAKWLAWCVGGAIVLIVGGIVLKLCWWLVMLGWNLL